MKKTILAILLILSMLFVSGCSNDEEKYPPVESTEEEAKVMFTLKAGDEEYEVRYELYRALFLNNKATVDKGNDAVWSGENAQIYIDQINEFIIHDAAEIFAAIHIAGEIGYDAYSKEADNKIKEFIAGAVEGDSFQLGHGSYDKYLENLKKNNLNYSAATLLYRYALAETAIESYYNDDYEYSREDVEAYYYGDDCARILQAYFPTGTISYSKVNDYRASLAEIDDEYALAVRIIGSTAATETDLIIDGKVSGVLLGKTTLSQQDFHDYISTVFGLENGKVSKVITVENSNADGYYIVYKLDKTAEHFNDFYFLAENSYIENIIGGVLGGAETELSESVTFTSDYNSISHKDISMN